MFNKLIVFLFFLLGISQVTGQTQRIQIRLDKVPPGINTDFLVIGSYYGDQFSVVHREEITNDSTIILDINFSTQSRAGLFEFYIEDKAEKETNRAEIILSITESPKIEAHYYQLKNGSFSVGESVENQAYNDLLALKEYYEPQLLLQREKRNFLSEFDPEFKKKSTQIELETELIQSKFDQELISVKELYPNTFTSRVLLPLSMIPVRSSDVEWAKNYDSYLSFLHQNYFYFVDFNNSEILRHYAFADKLFYFFNDFTEKSAQGAEKGIDLLMNYRKENQEVNSFLFNHLLLNFLKLDSEPLTKYLMDNYSSSCSLELPFEEFKKLKTMQALSIGGMAPEISLPDLNSKYQSLRAFCGKNDYTILFFWLSWCSRCEKEMPVLNEIYQKYKSLDLGVFTVSLDEEKVKWQEKLLTMNKNWVNVAELVPIPNSSVIKNYNISTTPIIYVLDSSGKVLTKGLYGSDLDKFLSELR